MRAIGSLILAVVLTVSAKVLAATGHEEATVPDPDDKPLAAHIWFPRSDGETNSVKGEGLPLIVMSHGTGGGAMDQTDTALALAEAGFIVAAVTHTGDNFKDLSYVGGTRALSDRPRHIARVIDYMLTTWSGHQHLDPARIGMFGFSSGGFTALVVAGGRADLSRTIEYCRDKPQAWSCVYIKAHGWTPEAALRSGLPAPVHDPRVKAAIVAAPSVGWSFEPDGLANVAIPIQLWAATKDHVVPYADNTGIVRRQLGSRAEFHEVAGADHFAFLAPCSWRARLLFAAASWFGGEDICRDPPSFDRTEFHTRFNHTVIAFFSKTLKSP